MYHSISDDQESNISAYYQTNTSLGVFQQHMRYLKEEHFRVIDLREACTFLKQPSRPNDKTVVLTFDDGFKDFHSRAFPVLQEHGFTATVFLPTGFIGCNRRSFKGKECLTWDEVREMRKCGMQFGSHTVNHPRLAELSWKEIEREVHDSKIELEHELGQPVTNFAYPFAYPQAYKRFVCRFEALLANTGYNCNATTKVGRAYPGNNLYALNRLPVNGCDDRALFRAKLEGAYDWLAWPQAVVKRMKTAFSIKRAREAGALSE
jgi:peptidoglycan/xylan/chitin deacetylase (PgdA/CDA1 family)